jgi:hypothetical protein
MELIVAVLIVLIIVIVLPLYLPRDRFAERLTQIELAKEIARSVAISFQHVGFSLSSEEDKLAGSMLFFKTELKHHKMILSDSLQEMLIHEAFYDLGDYHEQLDTGSDQETWSFLSKGEESEDDN